MNKVEMKKLNKELNLLRNTNFKKGEPDGFNRCLGSAFYAFMDISNYKRQGILKVWNAVQEIDQTVKENKRGPQSSYRIIYDTLYEEANIITDDAALEKAKRFVAEFANDKAQKQRVLQLTDMIQLYESAMVRFMDFEEVEQYQDKIMNIKLNAGYEAYKKGIAAGFFRCIAMFLYAALKTTNYKYSGLMRIYQRTLDIDKAIEDENCALNDELLCYALYEETDIICSPEFIPLAEAYAEEYSETKTKKGYQKQVSAILNSYYNIVSE